MKKRVISVIVALIILIPIIIIGGTLYYTAVLALSMIALKEYMDAKENKKKIPFFIKIICYAAMLLLLMSTYINQFKLTIDTRVICGLFISLMVPTLLYHNKAKYNIEDTLFLIGGIFLIGLSMTMLVILRNRGINILVYALLITIFTDTYAFLTGSLIGKTPLLKNISPKKTIEGTIGGTIFGVCISSAYYLTVIDPTFSIWGILVISLFLSILGQFGDLIFSSIKRYYNIKDFSNIMPGHGGILDRLDSIILVSLGMMLFMNIL